MQPLCGLPGLCLFPPYQLVVAGIKTRRTGTNLTLMSLNPGPLHFLCCADHAMAWTASETSPSPLVETSSESILQFESSGYHCNHTELCVVDWELFTLKIFHVKIFFVLLNFCNLFNQTYGKTGSGNEMENGNWKQKMNAQTSSQL